MKYSEIVKNHLFSIIKEMDSYKWLFTTNPRFDFTRTKKWSFEETLKFMVCTDGNSLKDELLKYFEYSSNTPTNSSFNQRRAQILPEAFHYLFREFTSFCEIKENLYNGYRLLAIDGSDICIARNPNDERTYFQNSPETKGFNQVHVNASYDLLSRIYTDIIIQPAREENEKEAMCNIIDRYKKPIKTIFIADRGYEAYNILAHAEAKEQYYLIRAKDIHSTGILSGLHTLPQEESFDTEVSFILTNKKQRK